MDPAIDINVNTEIETPRQEPPKASTTKRPPPPINHNIQILTAAFQEAILENDIFELTAVDSQYSLAMKNDPDFLKYDRSDLKLAHKQAQEILNAHTAASTPLPQPPNNHIISILTDSFQLAIQENDIDYIKILLNLHDEFMKSSPDYVNYDRAALHTAQLTATQLIYRVTVNINNEPPRQDPQKPCTRNSPCLQQGCLICSTPINHVRNLDVSLTNHVRNLDVSLINHVCNLDVSPINHVRNLDVSPINHVRNELALLTKEKGILNIMKNTTVDPIKNTVSVQYLYKENLAKLGENYFGATKSILTIHNKIFNKPEISPEIDKYVQKQDNKNYEKVDNMEFKTTLPKHHAEIGAVERVIGSIKNTISKSISGPHQLRMNDEELLTQIHMVIDKLNNRPLILGAPLGITLTPKHVLLGYKDCYGDEVNPDVTVQNQISRWRIVLNLYYSLWDQEYTRRRLTVTWKEQGVVPKVGDIVLFKNEDETPGTSAPGWSSTQYNLAPGSSTQPGETQNEPGN